MGGMRAVLASLGASVSLVAGAALALLAASFIFAYDGIVGSVDASPGQTSLQVTPPASQERGGGASASSDTTPTLVVEPRKPAAAKRSTPKSQARAATGVSENRAPSSGVKTPPPPAAAPAPAPTPAPQHASPAKPQTSKTGDGVRKFGDGVADAVQDTGKALGGAVQPLSPPVSQAVEKVLDVIATVVQNAVNGLAGALDKSLIK